MDHDLPDFDLSRFLPYRLSVAGDRLSAGLARRYRAEFGISVAEWRVLVHVTDAGEVSIRDLERRVNLEKSKASRAATRLAQAGYIRKAPNPADRRLLCLSLSETGRELMSRLLPIASAYQARLEEIIGDRMSELEAALEIMATSELD